MATPSSSLATLRPELGASLTLFDLAMSQKGFVAPKVAPVIEVDKQSGPFGKINIEALLQTRNTTRTSRGAYSRQDWQFTTSNYGTIEYGAEEKVDDRDKNLYGSYFIAEQLAASRARDAVLRNYELRMAAAIFNTTTWTGSSLTGAVTSAWSNFSASTPIADITAGKKAVYNNIGLQANTLIINYHVYLNLQQNADLISRIKYSGLQDPNTDKITSSAMAQAFGIDQIVIAGAQYNSANEGQAASLAPAWADANAMLAYVAQSDDIQEPCIARTFHWGGDGSTVGGTMESYRDETVRADIIRCRHDVQELVLVPQCGYLLSNIT
jgi:hypothetical protein